jgi:hypothetical protein
MAWHSIRTHSVVLYPQFPAFQRFIDFANPYLRIGLEIDGKQHKQEEDRQRDEYLAGIGWRIFRVPAAQVFAEIPDISKISEQGLDGARRVEAITKWMLESDVGVVHAIERIFFCRDPKRITHPEDGLIRDLSYETLEKHRLAKFPLDK